jgi:hypothetical protein
LKDLDLHFTSVDAWNANWEAEGVSLPNKCSKCGRKWKENSNFCGFCGIKLDRIFPVVHIVNNGRLFVDLTYNILQDTVRVDSNIKDHLIPDTILEFVRTQIGAGKDDSKANELEEYHIRLELDLSCDRFYVTKDDTGNKGLRDGILIHLSDKLEKNET